MTVKAEQLHVVELARRAAKDQLSFFDKLMAAKNSLPSTKPSTPACAAKRESARATHK